MVSVCQDGGSIRVLADARNLPGEDDPAMAAAVLSAIEPSRLPAAQSLRPSITAHDVMGCTMAPADTGSSADAATPSTMDLACTVRVRFVLNQADS